MAIKDNKNLYLCLALACFAGILAVFIVDGYLGIYDTLYIKYLESEQKIEADAWREPWIKEQGYGIGVAWGEPIHFRYKIENRTFSTYQVDVRASCWKSGERIAQLLDQSISIAPFDEVELDWTLRPEVLGKASIGIGEQEQYSVRINLGRVEHKVVLSYYRGIPGYPEKVPQPVPIPESK